MEARQTIQVNAKLVVRLRAIAKREGWVLARLAERLIEAGLKAEKSK